MERLSGHPSCSGQRFLVFCHIGCVGGYHEHLTRCGTSVLRLRTGPHKSEIISEPPRHFNKPTPQRTHSIFTNSCHMNLTRHERLSRKGAAMLVSGSPQWVQRRVLVDASRSAALHCGCYLHFRFRFIPCRHAEFSVLMLS